MKKMKKLLALVLCLMMSVGVMTAFTGCSKDATNGTIIVSTMFGAGDAHNPVFTKYNGIYTKISGVAVSDRSGSAEGNWPTQVMQDLKSENNVPDIIFHTSGAGIAEAADKVVSVADIRKEFPNFVTDLVVDDEDPASVPMKSGAQAIIYNTDKYAATDFNTVETMVAKIKTEFAAGRKTSLSAQLCHYWFNHLMAYNLGYEEYAAFDGTKEYFDDADKKTAWETALVATVADLRAMGTVDPANSTGGNAEPDNEFWAGSRYLMLDGNWVKGNYPSSPVKDKLSFSNFPQIGKTSKDDAEKVGFTIGGVTNGWYITKKAWSDTSKRAKLVQYVELMSSPEAINEYCVAGGGLAANGLPTVNVDGSKPGSGLFFNGVKAENIVLAIDDRVSSEAKGAFLSTWNTTSGLPKFLFQSTEPAEADIKALFANDFIAKL